jgi:hypothetical protein
MATSIPSGFVRRLMIVESFTVQLTMRILMFLFQASKQAWDLG